jgi:hypothetical protein
MNLTEIRSHSTIPSCVRGVAVPYSIQRPSAAAPPSSVNIGITAPLVPSPSVT